MLPCVRDLRVQVCRIHTHPFAHAHKRPIQRVKPRVFRNLYFGDGSVLVDDYSLQCYQPAHDWLRWAAVLVLVV